jgi:Family of unknown function (DUF6148)
MSITLQIAQQRLTQYLDAEAAVLSGQEYRIADRSLKRADLGEIRKGIEYWSDKADNLSLGTAGGTRRSIVPRPLW